MSVADGGNLLQSSKIESDEFDLVNDMQRKENNLANNRNNYSQFENDYDPNLLNDQSMSYSNN